MKKFINIVNSSFMRNIFRSTSGWWEYRIKIWKKYHLKALKNQTNKDFYYLLNISNKTPKKFIPIFRKILKESGLKSLIVNRNNEEELKKIIGNNLPRAKYVYLTRIDTDDIYHKTVIDEIKKYNFESRRILFYQKGYQYDCVNDRMRNYYMQSPPFYTIMFPWDTFLNSEKRKNYKGSSGHDTRYSTMNPVVMSKNKFIVLVHNRNKRARPEHLLESNIFSEGKKNKVLKEFNINKYEEN